ncbi:CRE-CDC-25.1 protein [Caenorhabditis remanei]|uniref:M-phase inducer phosphatase n=1 Tax=Caenorhabditis remanei TaxID=31234 RepID=E3MVV3_CAERE|nr:CRE-CDC-25.1 protein [Caenorhabditis remanei]
MTTAAAKEHEIYIDRASVNMNVVVGSNEGNNAMFEEDADSRDSGVSMTSCSDKKDVISPVRNVDFSKVETRLALSDCSNFVAKIKRNSSVSSSRSSSFYNYDTPTGRKMRTVFDTDSLDQSLYEKKNVVDKTMEKHRKRSSSSMSPSFALMDQKRSRNLSDAAMAPQSDKICRYNGGLNVPNSSDPFGDEDGDDEVFLQSNQKAYVQNSLFAPPAPRTTTSLWDLAPPIVIERKGSDTSANGSFQERPKQILRAMSVGVIDHDLPSTLDVKYSLPAVENPQKASQAYRSISPITLLSEFQRLGNYEFDKKYVIVDCRFPFEYKGGHVRGAINVFRHDKIKSTFFPEDLAYNMAPKRIPIFYCEYSQKRGPAMAHAVRSIDRVRNELRYPHVEYPEMYLIDYGYKSLWNRLECRQICEPCSYIPMNHSLYSSEFKSARLERHHSMASLQPNGETGHRKEKTKRCIRSAYRRNNSTLSMLSRSSTNLSSTGRTSSTENVLSELENEQRGHRWVSAFDINSIGSEIDLDNELTNNFPVVSNASSYADLGGSERVVQLGFKVITPDFGVHEASSSSSSATISGQYHPLELHANDQNTPCATLDFSLISDTD